MDKYEVGALVDRAWKANRKRIAQKDLLDKLGVSRSHLNKIVNGRYPDGPTTDFLDSLARNLGGHLILKLHTPGTPVVEVYTDPITAECATIIEKLPEPMRRSVREMVTTLEASLPVDARTSAAASRRDGEVG